MRRYKKKKHGRPHRKVRFTAAQMHLLNKIHDVAPPTYPIELNYWQGAHGFELSICLGDYNEKEDCYDYEADAWGVKAIIEMLKDALEYVEDTYGKR